MKRLEHRARREQVVRTTNQRHEGTVSLDRVNRQFKAERPNQLWSLGLHLRSAWQAGCTWPS
jgi:transposase InsO family protein